MNIHGGKASFIQLTFFRRCILPPDVARKKQEGVAIFQDWLPLTETTAAGPGLAAYARNLATPILVAFMLRSA
jgi:hypothetical protein